MGQKLVSKNNDVNGVMERENPFSYHCQACGRCCYNKRIAVNPYEVLRLATNKGVSTNKFIRSYLEKEGPYLRVTTEGDCIFHSGKECGVHADRPFACRTYPLGRYVSGNEEETFRVLQPHPQCKGVRGEGGTVMSFLKQQGALLYLENADRYQALFNRLFDALQEELPGHPELVDTTETAMFTCNDEDIPAFMEWLDVERTVERYCKEQELVVPSGISKIVNLHIQAIDQWLNSKRRRNHE